MIMISPTLRAPEKPNRLCNQRGGHWNWWHAVSFPVILNTRVDGRNHMTTPAYGMSANADLFI